MPYWEAYRKPSRRKIDWEDVWCTVGAIVMIAILIAAFVVLGVYIKNQSDKNALAQSITEGLVLDKGHSIWGKSVTTYSCWVQVQNGNDVVIWHVSDDFYDGVNVGDWVKRR